MIQVRVPKVADLHALVVEIERSQILLPKPVPRLPIPYEDEVDVAVLEWIASHVRGVRQFEPKGAPLILALLDRAAVRIP